MQLPPPSIVLDDGHARRRFWAYATAFGATWGVFEVTVGTFLHTLRVPLAGPTLASVGAALLVAQRQLLPARGLTLATGLVAAACKAISPGGTILGPMIGIASEALLVELVLLPAPRAAFAAALAGGLVALLPLGQKLLVQVVYYGGVVLTLYLEALRGLARSLEIEGAVALRVGAAVLGGLSLLGAGLGLAGWSSGRRAARRSATASRAVDAGAVPPPSGASGALALRSPALPPAWLPTVLARQRDRAVAVLALGALVLQFGGRVPLALLGLGALLAGLGALRPEALRRLWRPRFWLLTLLLASLSGLLLGPRDLRLPGTELALLSSSGLLAGLLMVVRGALVFALTSWATVAADGAALLDLARRVGLHRLAGAVGGALALMPELQQLLSARPAAAPAQRRGRWRDRLAAGIAVAADLAERAASAPSAGRPRPVVAALVGARAAGKTSTLIRLHRALASAGLDVAGLCQPAHADRQGYDLLDLRSGERRPLARRRGEAEATPDLDAAGAPGREATRAEAAAPGFAFVAAAWSWAGERLARDWTCADVLIVDELGRLEAAGRGHLDALGALRARSAGGDPASHLAAAPRLLLLGVQSSVASAIADRLGGFDRTLHLPASDAQIDAFVDALHALLAGQDRATPASPAAKTHSTELALGACAPGGPSR